jgi:hypothetical protein
MVGVAIEAMNEWRRFNAQQQIIEEWEQALEIITSAAEIVATSPQPDALLKRPPPAVGVATAQEDDDDDDEPKPRRTVIHGYSRRKP